MIDWTKPLELMDGTPVVIGTDPGYSSPDLDGDYWIEKPDDPNEYWCVAADGCREGFGKPFVRNRLGSPPTTGTAVTKEPTETLRDRFAMAALTGLLARNNFEPAAASALAYATASAMLAARGEG